MESNNNYKSEVRISDLTWVEVKNCLDNDCKVAILPSGSLEQHGPHLPFGTDTYFAYEFSTKVALEANNKAGKPLSLVYPPVWYGNGGKWAKGEVWLRPTTLVNLYADLFEQILKQGFKYILVISGHGGNSSIIYNAINESQFNGVKPNVFYSCPWKMMHEDIDRVKETNITGHACEMETSTSMYLFPELVKMDRIKDPDTEEDEFWLIDNPYNAVKKEKVEHLSGGGQIGNRPGYIGNPMKASKEKGKIVLDSWVIQVVDFLLELDK